MSLVSMSVLQSPCRVKMKRSWFWNWATNQVCSNYPDTFRVQEFDHIVLYQKTNDSADVQDTASGNEEIVMASYGTKWFGQLLQS